MRALVAQPQRSALFLDFDGTLSPIVEDPVGARPLPEVPALLARLAERLGLVAVVSGRPSAFLADVLAAPVGVRLIGLYGLELALEGAAGVAWAGAIEGAVAEARAEAPAGVYVEPKGLTMTLHWRQAPAAQPWAESFAERQQLQRDLVVHPARRSLELRPPVEVDKGTVLRHLLGEMADMADMADPTALAVFGDDVGDLPAFGAAVALRERWPALAVVRVAAVDGESPPEVAAAADLTVAGPVGAVALLEELAVALS